MTPGNIQLTAIVNKALLAKVTDGTHQVNTALHSFSTNSEQVSFSSGGRGNSYRESLPQPDHVRHLIITISFHCFNLTITLGRIICIL